MLLMRVFGAGLIGFGLLLFLLGIAELRAERLLLSGGRRGAWPNSLLLAFFGQYAYMASAYIAFCLASYFSFYGFRLFFKSKKNPP